MRPLALILGAALAVTATPTVAAETGQTFRTLRLEIDRAEINGEDVITWDSEAWIGGDTNKAWFKFEGEIEDGDTHETEIQALWSRNVGEFWDVQAGIRTDLEPSSRTYFVLGVHGLAPYQFETDAALFISTEGDVSARLHYGIDILFTQRLVLEPHVELNAYAEDDPERGIGAGLADIELGAQLRYEITREVAPYIDLVWERAVGETASIIRAANEDVETSSVRAGIRFWF